MILTSKANMWGAAATVAALLLSSTAQAAPAIDRAAALLIYPKIRVVTGQIETRLQISNESSTPTTAHCFYVNANSHCTNTGLVCTAPSDCVSSAGSGVCRPGWIETNFDIALTSQQPLGWLASDGLAGNDLPCVPTFFNPTPCAPGVGSNAGTRVPPVSESPFIGELKCIQSDSATRLPAPCDQGLCRNDLSGTAAIFKAGAIVDAASYNANGLRATRNNGDEDLIIGAADPVDAEYEPCPSVLVLDFFFDGASDPISGSPTSSELTLVPCTQDFRAQTIPPVTAQFLVYNEFEQRFSTSRQVSCLLDSELSRLDTTQPERSIFNANVSGTIAGQARIRGVNGGLVGAAVLSLNGPFGDPASTVASYSLDQAVERSASDVISLP